MLIHYQQARKFVLSIVVVLGSKVLSRVLNWSFVYDDDDDDDYYYYYYYFLSGLTSGHTISPISPQHSV